MRNLLLVLLGPLLVVAVLEGLAYVWERSQANGPHAWELVAARRIDLVPYPEPDPGYTLIKPGSHYEWQGISVEINSHGLRGPGTSFDRSPGTFRILNLGDSVVMGWGVRERETYGRQLAQLLNQRATEDRRYEVINAGVPGWNLENARAYLLAEGQKFDPDLVLLGITIVNDIYGKNALLAHDRPVLFEWLRTNTYFWPFLRIQLRWLKARVNGQQRIPVIDPPSGAAAYFPLDPTADRWGDVWNQVLAIDRWATEREISLLLVLFPLEFQVLQESYSTLPQELLRQKATEAGIPVLDPLPAFRRACRSKPGGACSREDRYLFADVWMHPSAHGHELIAREIATFLNAPRDEPLREEIARRSVRSDSAQP